MLSRDPSGEGGSLNLYEFVRNNPIAFVDRIGLCCDAEQNAYDSAHLATEAAQDQADISTNTYLIKVSAVAPAAVNYFNSIQPEKPMILTILGIFKDVPSSTKADGTEMLPDDPAAKALETANDYAEFKGQLDELFAKAQYDAALQIAENAYQQMLVDDSALADASTAEFAAFVALLQCQSQNRMSN